MSKGWTQERRKKQAEAIRRHKPWEKSTGPRSDAGKAKSSQNALKHGLYGIQAKTIKALLRKNTEFLELYARLNGVDDLKALLKRTDKKFNKIKAPSPSKSKKRETE